MKKDNFAANNNLKMQSAKNICVSGNGLPVGVCICPLLLVVLWGPPDGGEKPDQVCRHRSGTTIQLIMRKVI